MLPLGFTCVHGGAAADDEMALRTTQAADEEGAALTSECTTRGEGRQNEETMHVPIAAAAAAAEATVAGSSTMSANTAAVDANAEWRTESIALFPLHSIQIQPPDRHQQPAAWASTKVITTAQNTANSVSAFETVSNSKKSSFINGSVFFLLLLLRLAAMDVFLFTFALFLSSLPAG